MTMWKWALALSIMVLSKPAWADDRLVDLSDPKTVSGLLLQAGYKAEIRKTKEDQPYIVSASNGNEFQIVFYGCKKQIACQSFEYYSWYKKDPLFSLELLNEWNARKRFLKVAIDSDGDLAEYLYVSAVGKSTYANFIDTLSWFTDMDGELSRFLSERRNAPPRDASASTAK